MLLPFFNWFSLLETGIGASELEYFMFSPFSRVGLISMVHGNDLFHWFLFLSSFLWANSPCLVNIEISNKNFKKYKGFKATALADVISGYTCYYLRLYLFENDLAIFYILFNCYLMLLPDITSYFLFREIDR